MVAMLFDGGGGQDQQSGFTWESVDLFPIQVGEVAGIRDPAFHFAAAPVAGCIVAEADFSAGFSACTALFSAGGASALFSCGISGSKVTIFPGFIKPLGS